MKLFAHHNFTTVIWSRVEIPGQRHASGGNLQTSDAGVSIITRFLWHSRPSSSGSVARRHITPQSREMDRWSLLSRRYIISDASPRVRVSRHLINQHYTRARRASFMPVTSANTLKNLSFGHAGTDKNTSDKTPICQNPLRPLTGNSHKISIT